MDITVKELKLMKAKQLRRIIREAIQEVLSEDNNALVTTKTGIKTVTFKNPTELNTLKSDSNVSSITTTSGQKIKESDELDELARIAKGYKISDDNIDVSQFANKKVSGVSISDVIDYIRENPGVEKKEIQTHFNFVRPQIANALVNALLDSGIIVKLGAGGEVEAIPEPGSEQEPSTQATEPEDLFMGSAENPLSMYFDDVPNDNGEEDINDEDEPTVGDIEQIPVSAANISDADYESFMKYTDLKSRLDSTKSNILKVRRRKGELGDISDQPSDELSRLQTLKKSLEDRIKELVSNSDYLKKRLSKSGDEENIDNDIEEQEPIQEEIDKYTIGKWQYYAGIRK
jgi:hypothetical protein